MAAIASTASGNWSAPGTWAGAVVPCKPFSITAITNSSGLIELTLATAADWSTNDPVNIYGAAGIPSLNPVAATPTIIDKTGVVKVGSWSVQPGQAGKSYNGEDCWYIGADVGGAGTAAWTFTGLTASTAYKLGLSHTIDGYNATNTPWNVYDSDGTTSLGSGTINEQATPNSRYRTLAIWGADLHSTDGSTAAALAVLAADPTLISGMIIWVRDGYRPTNVVYSGATYPGDTMTLDANGNALGGTVGPMAYLSPETGGGGAALLMGF